MNEERARRSQIEARILAWMREGVRCEEAPHETDAARFEQLALELFEHQFRFDDPYRELCLAAGVSPDKVQHWQQIPLVPTSAFKHARLATFAKESTRRIFRTSGTTLTARGELHLDTLELYETSLLATFPHFVCPELELGERMHFSVLAPSPQDAPDSSLSYMFGVVLRELGSKDSRFWLRSRTPSQSRGWEASACVDELERRREPIALVGTAFAFVHLIDFLDDQQREIELPAGSRVMETGGFKGQSREIPRDELHGLIASRLGVPRERIINQYGMCELGSQFYEPSLRSGQATQQKIVPPWVRTRAITPDSLEDVPAGEIGVLAHYDLANTGSVIAILTSDLGRVQEDRVEVYGRLPGAEARGCSRAADALLGA